MFQFFKKSEQKEKSRSLQTSPTKSSSSGKSFGDVYNSSGGVQAPTGVLCSLEEEEEDDVFVEESNDACSFSSQLSKSLPQILADKGALGYFIQFMETKNSGALIKFWLEVECLCGSLHSRRRRNDNVLYSKHNTGYMQEIVEVPNSLDSNDNINSNATHNDTDSRVNATTRFKENVNNADTESNYTDMPKTNAALSGMRQSNNNCEVRNCDVSKARQDALKIYKKYIIKDALGTNRISEELKQELAKALANEFIEPILQCLSAVQKTVYSIVEVEYINDFIRSEFHCKHQIDVLTSGDVQLRDILYNETAFFYFMEFMELENKRELLDFWMSAINYKQNLLEKDNTADPDEAQTDALIIYDKYFSLQASMPIGFSDKIRFEIEQNICREDGKGPQPDCFDKPRRIVYNFLNKYYLPTFLSSQLYYKYLSELISTVQSNPCSNVQARVKRAGSDCSSEVSSVSVSVHGAPQAGYEENKFYNKRSSIHSAMNIDTRQLYDPDSLWKRNKYSLSVGYIDELGRFVTEIEPDPQKKHESRLTRAVKKLVNMDQNKAKEELAWKIAEMIVREITSLTLGTSNLPS